MGSKLGRPISGEEKLTHDLKVRVDETTYEKLIARSEKENVTKAEIARQAIVAFLKKDE